MLTHTEKTLLRELLALAPLPGQTFTINELIGYMFGLAITPVPIPEDEWMAAIFRHDSPELPAADQARSMATALRQVYQTSLQQQRQGVLYFPYQLETLEREGLEEVLEWVGGLEAALELRPEYWEPDENDTALTPKEVEELFFANMVIQGLVDPVEVMPFFSKLPEEIFSEMFVEFEQKEESREMQIQAFLLATLPLSIQTLQVHGEKLRENLEKSPEYDSVAEASQFNVPVSGQSPSQPRLIRRDNVIRVDFSQKQKLPPIERTLTLYQLKVTIPQSSLSIWRRVVVPGWISLAELHQIIQVSMGWHDDHQHHFVIDGIHYGPRKEETSLSTPHIDEQEVMLDALALVTGAHITYLYDYVDNWLHQVIVEEVEPQAPDKDQVPTLLDGEGACPPENVGGNRGYKELLEAMNDPNHDNHQSMLGWVGQDFHPDRFDESRVHEINTRLLEMFL